MSIGASMFRLGTQGGKRNSQRYIIELTLSDGRKIRRTAHADRRASEQMKAQLVRQAERGEVGIEDLEAEAKRRPLTEHVANFLQAMREGTASAGRVRRPAAEEYIQRVGKRLAVMSADLGWSRVGDLDAAAAAGWISRQGWSGQTPDMAVVMLKQFSAWLGEQGLREQPFARLRGSWRRAEKSFHRAHLLPDQVELAAETAEQRPLTQMRHGKVARYYASLGRERGHAVRLAAYSGIRRGELLQLLWSDYHHGDNPWVLVRGETAKNGKTERIDLPRFVGEKLEQHRAELSLALGRPVHQGDLLFPRTGYRHLTVKFGDDLEYAGLGRRGADGRVRNEQGLVIDFHSLRVSYATWLVQSGTHPAQAMRLMRHADIRLTMQTYARVTDADIRAAVDKLPEPRERPAGAIPWRRAPSQLHRMDAKQA